MIPKREPTKERVAMIVCICNNVSEKTISSLIQTHELRNIPQLQKEIKVCNQCKCCASTIKDMIDCEKFKKQVA